MPTFRLAFLDRLDRLDVTIDLKNFVLVINRHFVLLLVLTVLPRSLAPPGAASRLPTAALNLDEPLAGLGGMIRQEQLTALD